MAQKIKGGWLLTPEEEKKLGLVEEVKSVDFSPVDGSYIGDNGENVEHWYMYSISGTLLSTPAYSHRSCDSDGTCFNTKENAQKAINKAKAKQAILKWHAENDGHVANWDNTTYNWYGEYNTVRHELDGSLTCTFQSDKIYFSSGEKLTDCQKALPQEWLDYLGVEI